MKGLVVGLLIAALVLSCAVNNRRASDELAWRMEKMSEITALWTQIRQYRGDPDMGLPLDPSQSAMIEFGPKTVQDARKVCPDNHRVPPTCTDTCTLSGYICDNADLICKIADELGKHDRAQEKCTSAKASCREAKQKCCNCSVKPPVVEPPATSPAPAAQPAPAAMTTPTRASLPAPSTTKASAATPKKVAR